MVSYIESAAGVAGGRTGIAAMVTGVLFILALFVAPVLGAIPNAETAPTHYKFRISTATFVACHRAWSTRAVGAADEEAHAAMGKRMGL